MAVRASSRTSKKIFGALSADRLRELLDRYELEVSDRRVVADIVAALVSATEQIDMAEVFSSLNRVELQNVCTALGIDNGGREKEVYRNRLIEHLRNLKTQARATGGRSSAASKKKVREPRPSATRRRARVKGESVFIVHGHDEPMRLEIKGFLQKLDLHPVVLKDEPSEGLTILEKLEKHQAESSYAVVLLSPDDMGYSVRAKEAAARPRARQNVVLELGMVLMSLGRHRVAVLHTGDLELPSDIHGFVYIPYDARHPGDAMLQLARELKQAGFDVDLNQAL